MGAPGNIRPVGQYKPRTPVFRVTRISQGYVVVDKDGMHASGIHGSGDCAQTVCDNLLAEHQRKSKRKDRPCMRCETVFPSEGIHNRMCGRCRHHDGGWDPHGLSKRSGRPG